MNGTITLEIDFCPELFHFKLPVGLDRRLQELLNRQDRGEALTPQERAEAEGLIELSEFLSLLRLRAKRMTSQ